MDKQHDRPPREPVETAHFRVDLNLNVNIGLSPQLETFAKKFLHDLLQGAVTRIDRKLEAVIAQGRTNMAKIEEVQASAQKHRDAVDAFIARAKADFDNLKAKGVTEEQLSELKNTLDGGVTVVEAMDLDPDFPATNPNTPPDGGETETSGMSSRSRR